MADALYLPAGDGRFTATEHTVGPWGAGLQHGGPVAALLTRAVEQQPARWPFTVVRIAVEILGPVPTGTITVTSRSARGGRSVELVEAELSADGRTAAVARGWRIRASELQLPEATAAAAAPPPMPAEDWAAPTYGGGFLSALQIRVVTGNWMEPGPMTLWARLRHPVVAGEEATPLQRLMTLADCGNGVSSVLPIDSWVFINPDLTVHLSRRPAGEWFAMEASTGLDPAGFGLARSRLFDADGEIGVGAQSLFVSPRSG
ncbi:MAG TPA: thioesterase family protein [Mycobacteriales bacterium]|nr:thioesterase family protein [Mycobacteriales bacterium]